MAITAHGTIHGNTIQLDSELGLPEGAHVEVTVIVAAVKRPWGEGIKRSAGVAANLAEFDEAFQQTDLDRKAAQFRESAS